ncbi:MAG: hypothetical protein CSA49_01315 [Gammaproteobacteria bacterium]|nr:MAG: hypothetical protein CSA49_01315 [Gammaproteobacteria bacterium]
MKSIVQLFWQICLMRTGPDQVPAAAAFTVFILFIYAALSLFARLVIGELPVDYSVVSLVVITALWALSVYAVLQFKGLASRFQQTFTAALGADVLLTLVTLPLVVVSINLPETSPEASLVALSMLVLFVWDVLIKGFIFHKAFNVSPLQGNLFSFMLNFVIFRLDQALLTYFVPSALEKLQG